MKSDLPSSKDIPKTIWMLWFQGLENAPELVKACYASWKTLNPGWTINFLNGETYQEYMGSSDLLLLNPKAQALSDIIRINLLAKHGGVWVDATSFCVVPLDTWLPDHAHGGFFAFHRTKGARIIDSWFLASSLQNPLTLALCEKVNTYWRENPALERRPKLARLVHPFAKNPKTTNLWFTLFVTKVLKVYPYMWLAFLFTKLIRKDTQARLIWQSTRKIHADGPHRLQEIGLLEPVTEDIKREMAARSAPVYKLNWRPLKEGVPPESVAAYLLDPEYLKMVSSTA